MNTYGVHTYKWINAKGEVYYVKYHLINGLNDDIYLSDDAAEDYYK
jgi:catalase